MNHRIKILMAVLVCSSFVAVPRPASAQEVNGIYTESATKDLGEVTKIDLLKGIKFRGWVDGYYVYNFNRPSVSVANANQGMSAIKSRDLTIEGRTFDVHQNSFSLSLAELEIERVPELGGVGFKFDFAAGDTQDIIVDTIAGVSPNSVSFFDKTFQHASISYLAPVGSGLRFDFGKFVTHIGGETITSIKNRNFSHAFFYTYGIPFQDTGLRVNYAFSPKVYGEVYILNGWNVTSDNNSGKTYGVSLGLTPNPRFSLYANYLGGPEQNNNNGNWRHLGDFQIIAFPTEKLQTMFNIDIGKDNNALGPGNDALWGGFTFYLRPNIKDRFFPTLRVEYYNDPDGFSTAVAQHLWGYTFTADYRLGKKESFAKVMLRPEIRYDMSNVPFFSRRDDFRLRKHQLTAGIGLVVYF